MTLGPRTRAPLAFVVLFGTSLPSFAPAYADEPGVDPPLLEEPALARRPPAAVARPFFARAERGPRLKLGYRTFSISEMEGRDSRFHAFTFDYYFYSGIVRAGAGLEAAGESSPRDNFLLAGTLTLGAQYPTGLTPFLDLVFSAGALRRDVLHQDLVDFAWALGLEGGGELFIGKLLLSLGLGWRRQVARHEGNDQVETVYVYYDSFTVRVGLGF